MFNIFKKKAKKTDIDEMGIARTKVSRVEVKRFEPERIEVKKFEPKRFNPFELKYRDTETGEIHIIDTRDDEAFDRVMSNRNNQIIFG